MQMAYTQLSQKGLITIPQTMRRSLGLDEKKQPLLKLSQKGMKVVVEPVKAVDTADIRVYSDSEVDQFIKEDQLTNKKRNDAQNYLKNLS
jgi:bifunctional DNA-binding transcriptional regulator/antitoxin component of YhaV-PrlF toxin-antitoxin module